MNLSTFSNLRKNLKELMDKSFQNHEPIIIRRPQGRDMILLPLRDYESLSETAYLLGHKANADHLYRSLQNLQEGKVVVKKLEDFETE